MCLELTFDGLLCDCIRDLRSLGLEIVAIAGEDADTFDDNECLCCVDMEKTAERNNLDCVEIDSMDYTLRTRDSEHPEHRR